VASRRLFRHLVDEVTDLRAIVCPFTFIMKTGSPALRMIDCLHSPERGAANTARRLLQCAILITTPIDRRDGVFFPSIGNVGSDAFDIRCHLSALGFTVLRI
jgi:hypothetical protein